MREIKFRAWDNKNKEFVRAVPSLEVLLDDPDAPVSHHDYSDEEAIYFYPNDPMGPTFRGRIKYEQYTGLEDKDGKEIYEGDIVKTETSEGHRICLVEGDDMPFGGFRLKVLPLDVNTEKRRTLDTLEIEIIGNIHENPELLK